MPLSMKKLESYLQNLNDFDFPKLELEQYATPPKIAALILNTVDSTYDDLQGKLVADLGCGTGRLMLGSVLCGAAHVIGFDIDDKALKGALANAHETFVEEQECSDDYTDEVTLKPDIYSRCPQFNLIQVNVASETYDPLWSRMNKMFDTVIMNPPFGTKHNAGIDVKFLERAIKMSKHSVYSLHKTSTRNHILKRCNEWAVTGKPIAQIRYNLSNTYRFHRRNSVDVDVDLWRVKVNDRAV